MTLRLTLMVDEGDAADLVALLAKALGRGELGIMDFRLEAVDRPNGARAPYVAPKTLAHVGKPYTLRNRKRTGGTRFATLRPAFEKAPLHLTDIRAVLKKEGYSTTGLSGAIAAWVRYGLIEKIGPGRYQLKGAAHGHEA